MKSDKTIGTALLAFLLLFSATIIISAWNGSQPNTKFGGANQLKELTGTYANTIDGWVHGPVHVELDAASNSSGDHSYVYGATEGTIPPDVNCDDLPQLLQHMTGHTAQPVDHQGPGCHADAVSPRSDQLQQVPYDGTQTTRLQLKDDTTLLLRIEIEENPSFNLLPAAIIGALLLTILGGPMLLKQQPDNDDSGDQPAT